MEHRASETGPENLRRDEDVPQADVGRKDFMFGATGVGLMVIAAIVIAIISSA
jgi:hypothetical protein